MKTPSRSTNRRRRGFTLIEVMIAIAIVVVLIGIVGINVIGQRDDANAGAAKIQLNSIENALQNFYLDFNRFPTEDEGLEVLWSSEALDSDDDAELDRWKPYLTDPKPNDVWGEPWNYTDDVDDESRRYELWSNGPDREEGTDDDIRSWTEEDDAGFGGTGPAPE